jgi:hypothetical protein
MEARDAVAGLELPHLVADAVNDASDVVARVELLVRPFGDFPEIMLGGWDNGQGIWLREGICGYAGEPAQHRERHGLREGRNSPILRITSTNNNLDNDLLRARLWDRTVDNLDLGALADNSFLHLVYM